MAQTLVHAVEIVALFCEAKLLCHSDISHDQSLSLGTTC